MLIAHLFNECYAVHQDGMVLFTGSQEACIEYIAYFHNHQEDPK